MKFKSIESSLAGYKGQDSITIEETLGLFIDLCEDVRHETGNAIESCPVTSVDTFAARLGRCSRLLIKIFQVQGQLFHDSDVEKMIMNTERKLTSGSVLIDEAEERLIYLQKMQQEILEQENKLQELEEECRLLEGRIPKDTQERLDAYAQQKKELEEWYQGQEKLLKDAEEDVEQLKESLKEQEERSRELCIEQKQLESSLKSKTDEIQEKYEDNKLKEQKLQMLGEELTEKEEEKVRILQKTAEYEKQKEELEKWFGSVEAKENLNKLDADGKRVQYLEKALRELLSEKADLQAVQWIESPEAEKKLEDLKNAVSRIEHLIKDYRKQYEVVIRCFEEFL